MTIVIDIKNAVRNAIYSKDETIKFFFDEILTVKYPYVFFYIPSFRLDGNIDSNHWRKLTLMCVVEYAQSEGNSTTKLWEYMDKLNEAYSLFEFKDTKISAQNIEFKIVEEVLQMTFDLEFYVKEQETTEIMKELELQLTLMGEME